MMNEKQKMKGWVLDVLLVIIFFVSLFFVGWIISAIGCVILYFLLRNSFDYPKCENCGVIFGMFNKKHITDDGKNLCKKCLNKKGLETSED